MPLCSPSDAPCIPTLPSYMTSGSFKSLTGISTLYTVSNLFHSIFTAASPRTPNSPVGGSLVQYPPVASSMKAFPDFGSCLFPARYRVMISSLLLSGFTTTLLNFPPAKLSCCRSISVGTSSVYLSNAYFLWSLNCLPSAQAIGFSAVPLPPVLAPAFPPLRSESPSLLLTTFTSASSALLATVDASTPAERAFGVGLPLPTSCLVLFVTVLMPKMALFATLNMAGRIPFPSRALLTKFRNFSTGARNFLDHLNGPTWAPGFGRTFKTSLTSPDRSTACITKPSTSAKI